MPAADAGIHIYARNKRPAALTTFTPQRTLLYVHGSTYPASTGRNVDEVVRVLDGLQTDELCPCNWKKGEETLTAKLKK